MYLAACWSSWDLTGRRISPTRAVDGRGFGERASRVRVCRQLIVYLPLFLWRWVAFRVLLMPVRQRRNRFNDFATYPVPSVSVRSAELTIRRAVVERKELLHGQTLVIGVFRT
jgi:hypothetical protein